MLRIITLLNQKNHYLEKFYSLNESEILNFAEGNFSNLDNFYQTREKILEIIKYLDQELDSIEIDSSGLTSDLKNQVREALAIKDEYVNRILGQDLQILSCIESAKSMIIKELQEIRHSKKVLGSYKSKQFKRRLDEKV